MTFYMIHPGMDVEEYYHKFIELQERLRKSEQERLELEVNFNKMVHVTRNEEELYFKRLRSQYKQYVEDDHRRRERNGKIMLMLEHIESRAAMLEAKSQRLKILRLHYKSFLEQPQAVIRSQRNAAVTSSEGIDQKPQVIGCAKTDLDTITQKLTGNKDQLIDMKLPVRHYGKDRINEHIDFAHRSVSDSGESTDTDYVLNSIKSNLHEYNRSSSNGISSKVNVKKNTPKHKESELERNIVQEQIVDTNMIKSSESIDQGNNLTKKNIRFEEKHVTEFREKEDQKTSKPETHIAVNGTHYQEVIDNVQDLIAPQTDNTINESVINAKGSNMFYANSADVVSNIKEEPVESQNNDGSHVNISSNSIQPASQEIEVQPISEVNDIPTSFEHNEQEDQYALMNQQETINASYTDPLIGNEEVYTLQNDGGQFDQTAMYVTQQENSMYNENGDLIDPQQNMEQYLAPQETDANKMQSAYGQEGHQYQIDNNGEIIDYSEQNHTMEEFNPELQYNDENVYQTDVNDGGETVIQQYAEHEQNMYDSNQMYNQEQGHNEQEIIQQEMNYELQYGNDLEYSQAYNNENNNGANENIQYAIEEQSYFDPNQLYDGQQNQMQENVINVIDEGNVQEERQANVFELLDTESESTSNQLKGDKGDKNNESDFESTSVSDTRNK